MRFDGILFDFNGVLVWDSHLHEIAWRRTSELLRGTPLSDQEMVSYVHGRPNVDIFEVLTGQRPSGADLQRLNDQKEGIYQTLCLELGDKFTLSPGAIPLLEELIDRKVPFTIATSSERGNVDFFIKQLDLGRWFDLDLIVFDDGIRPGKPAPDIYLEAAAVLNLRPERCIVIEDSKSGIAAAKSAGVGHLIAIGPAEKHAELKAVPGVNQVIASLDAFDRTLIR